MQAAHGPVGAQHGERQKAAQALPCCRQEEADEGKRMAPDGGFILPARRFDTPLRPGFSTRPPRSFEYLL
jgi:hypothetical protein